MKKRSLLILLILSMILIFSAPISAEEDQTGYTPISTVEDLLKINENLNGNYYLTNDIKLPEKQTFTPIGNAKAPFTGSFDGNGFAIQGLILSTESGNDIGLFGVNYGAVRNVTVEGSIIIESTSAEDLRVGGICGRNYGLLLNCVNNTDITAPGAVGGIVGENHYNIRACVNKGTVTATGENAYAGGITGLDSEFTLGHEKGNSHYFSTNIYHCENNGTVSSDYCAGGIAGKTYSTREYAPNTSRDYGIFDCINNGNISADEVVGGIAGYMDHKFIGTSCNTVIVSSENPDAILGALVGEIPKNPMVLNNAYLWNTETSIDPIGKCPTSNTNYIVYENGNNRQPFDGFNYNNTWEQVSNNLFPKLRPYNNDIPEIKLQSQAMFFVGEENYLDVTFTPNRSTYALIWESSNPEVITVSGSGRVKAIAPGAATIIIRTVNGKILASCAVNVLRTPETTSFNDVNTTNWFYPYVDFAAKYGLYYGISEGVFAPNMEMTRAMVVTVLHRMEGSPEPQNIDYFDDINVYQWYGASVCWAAENNIVLGHGNGLFAPEDKVTREQFALILQRYAEWKQFEINSNYNLSAFADKSKVSPWAESAVKWAVGNKIINGKPSGYQTIIDPQGYTTRAEVAKMLSCFITEKYDFVKPTSVEASETEITMDAYTTYILSAKVYPEGALQKVSYTYDGNIISVDNGIVNALRPGTAEIRIYAGEGLKANVKVNILPGNSEFTITFETIKTFITENGNYDSETESYYYGYEGENYVSYIEYFPESNYFAFIYEEYFEDDMCMRHSISITDRRSPYNVSLHVTQGESIYAIGYAQINADTYTAFAEIPISSHYYYGPDEIDGKEFVYENTFLGTYYNLWCIDYILKNDIPEASLHALGFKQLVFEE